MSEPITDEQLDKFLEEFKRIQSQPSRYYETKMFVQRLDGSFEKVSWSPTHRRLYIWWNSIYSRFLEWKVKHDPTGRRH